MDEITLVRRSKRIIISLFICYFFFMGMYLMVGAPGINPTGQILNVVQIVGSFLSVTILAQFLYVTFIRPIDDHRLEKNIETIIGKKIEKIFTQSSYFGFGGFVKEINVAEIYDSLGPKDILWWLDTYDPHYRSWINNLRNALELGASIKMLVMNPSSTLVDMRAKELGKEFDNGIFKKELESFLHCINSIRNDEGYVNLEIRLYSDMPAAPIYIVERKGKPIIAYSSYFLGKATSVGFPYMRWERQGEQGFVWELESYLKMKWKVSHNKAM